MINEQEYIKNRPEYGTMIEHIIRDVPYKGWQNTFAGSGKVIFQDLKTGKEITKYGSGENWLENAWQKSKDDIDDIEKEYDSSEDYFMDDPN
jgi:hypothetical protein